MTHLLKIWSSFFRSLREGKKRSFALSEKEVSRLLMLSRAGFKKLEIHERNEFLQLGAKDFSGRFGGVVKILSHE